MSCAALQGCGGGDGLLPVLSSVRQEADASTVTARGDWNDVRAALLVGCTAAECDVVSDDYPSRGLPQSAVRFELLLVSGEEGWITFTRGPGGADPRGPETITMRANLGLYRRLDREKALLDATARRLEVLAGVDWAPIPGSDLN